MDLFEKFNISMIHWVQKRNLMSLTKKYLILLDLLKNRLSWFRIKIAEIGSKIPSVKA